MLIFLWIISFVIYLSALTLLVMALLQKFPAAAPLRNRLLDWLDDLKANGWFSLRPKKLPVELWKWETADDEEVCEDCLERASWPPMDIADWMKEGMPRTHEAETKCGENCRCELVIYDPRTSRTHHPRQQS